MHVVSIKNKIFDAPPVERSSVTSNMRNKIMPLSKDNLMQLKVKNNSLFNILKHVKQKNIQLRPDQIKKLREYTFQSGTIDGVQLNDSEICRVALDLFFWLEVNPQSLSNEEEVLETCKKKIKDLKERGN